MDHLIKCPHNVSACLQRESPMANSFHFTCPHCQHEMQLPSSANGRIGKCPSCNSTVTVTAPPERPPQPPGSSAGTPPPTNPGSAKKAKWFFLDASFISGVLIFAALGILSDVFGLPTAATVGIMTFWLACGFVGGLIGRTKEAGTEGWFIGFLLGPIGLIGVLALDKRPSCPHCGTRLNGRPAMCPACHSTFEWNGDECTYYPPSN